MTSISKKSVLDIDVKEKNVIVRVDFNVPIDKSGNITNDKRIVDSLPTIKHLLNNNAKVVLVSHFGRPKGFDDKYSLAPIAKRLSELLGQNVVLTKDVIGEDASEKVKNLKHGSVLLLENVRFHKEEEKNDPEFARKLANYGDIYVNDAFGTAHRAHASTAGIAKYLPSVSGLLMKKEIETIGNALNDPKRPFVAILGGAKVSDKIGVIESLLNKVDVLIIGGGMAYTFLKAKGVDIGDSICQNDKLDVAKSIISSAEKKGVKLLLPVDHVVGKELSTDTPKMVLETNAIPNGWKGMDIGPKTVKEFGDAIKNAKTIIWNGPMGVFEIPGFSSGTSAIACDVANSESVSIVGGGDTAAAVEKSGFSGRMTHISTGGGATLEFIEGKELPGVAVLMGKNDMNKSIKNINGPDIQKKHMSRLLGLISNKHADARKGKALEHSREM